jgi:hypothetical protein
MPCILNYKYYLVILFTILPHITTLCNVINKYSELKRCRHVLGICANYLRNKCKYGNVWSKDIQMFFKGQFRLNASMALCKDIG